jgi:RNA polymerase sigma-70 factor (ECF subfamily)
MDSDAGGSSNSRAWLDAISTPWTAVFAAHAGSSDSARAARSLLVLRYHTAVRRYLGAILRNDHDADELVQDVVVRIMNGDFAAAAPARGRFRDLLKKAVWNMAIGRRTGRTAALDPEAGVSAADPAPDAAVVMEQQWTSDCRAALLEAAWTDLELLERRGESLQYTVLRLRAERPDDDSPALAAALAEKSGRPFRPDAARQLLRRARLTFARLLVERTAAGLHPADPAAVLDELSELGLMEFVRDFLPADFAARGELRDRPPDSAD